MSESYSTNWCNNPMHSRSATEAERADDVRRRVEAIETEEREGGMGARQVAEHWRVLDGFPGYRRCTIGEY